MNIRIYSKWLSLILFSLCIATSYALPTLPIPARTITFVNNCTHPVWFGFSGGSAPSKLTGTTCNTTDDCYAGAKCTQTGAIKQCFWNNPQPANGNFQLAANGGTNSVTIPMLPNNDNIFWTGAVAGRTNCTSGTCQSGDCGTGGNSCNAGQGFIPPATQAEFSFSTSNVDFYDVEVINGFNVPIKISTNLTIAPDTAHPYICGSPGAVKPSSPLLGGCSWQFAPPSNDYRWVQNGGNACSLDSDCAAPTVCGLSFNPGNTQLLKKTCGAQIGYWTANQVCGIQSDYGAPFNCKSPLPSPENNLTMWNLYSCADVGSCYQNNASETCCGCTNWDQVGVTVPAAPYTQQCTNTNLYWKSLIQPTLKWLKQACPTAYTYPYDDMSSTFVCSVMQNNMNTTNYTITYCPTGAVPPPPTVQYGYTVFIGVPFSPVTINKTIICPDSTTHNPACLVANQSVGANMVIAGSNPKNICTLGIQANGSVVVNAGQSYGCNINSTPATPTQPGQVMLPSGF
jgi:hypothetical protein